MRLTQQIFTLVGSLFIFPCLHAQTNTPVAADSSMDCFSQFFSSAGKISSPNKTLLVTNTGKTVTLANFLKTAAMGGETQYGLADLDNDGKKELVIYDFTGGAHCCDEFYFFKNIAPNKYQYAAKTFAGDVCVTGKNEFIFDFHQQLGYFFTCFACEYGDTTETAANPLHDIVLKYSKGKLVVQPRDKDFRNEVTDNLAKLHEQPYERLEDDAAQDNGLRKEFAMNLAVFYYSFGHNLVETKKLFDKYYTYPDAKKVWAEFTTEIQTLRKNNTF